MVVLINGGSLVSRYEYFWLPKNKKDILSFLDYLTFLSVKALT
jgi:hypothetical protein